MTLQRTYASMPRYVVKFLFQWNPEPDGTFPRRRLCETSIRIFTARSAHDALARAKRLGHESEFRFRRVGGRTGRYQLVGILQLMELGVESEKNEVWWELSRKLDPIARRKYLIPREHDLWVFTDRKPKHVVRRRKARRLTRA